MERQVKPTAGRVLKTVERVFFQREFGENAGVFDSKNENTRV